MNIEILFAGVALLICANAAITIMVSRSELYEPAQRRLQYLLVWLLPGFGALVTWLVLRAQSQPNHPAVERTTGNPYVVENYPDSNEPYAGHHDGHGA